MSKIVQWKRGNVTVNDSYTGANGEITVDTTNWNLRVHDGVTAGGYTIDSSQGGSSFGNITVSGTTNLNGNVVANSYSKFGNVIILENQIFASTLTGNGNISIAGLRFRGDNSRIGYNTEPWPDGVGYDVDFGNTSVKAREFYADADFPTGFQFTTADGDTGLSHSYDTSQGNVSLVRIRHAGTAVAEFFDNAHTTLTGNLVISSDGATYGTFPNAFVQIYGNVDSYQQFVAQNINNGSDASTDIVATAGNGDDSSYYIDMGIASNTYAVSGFDVVGPNDGYLYVAGASYLGPVTGNANLNIGSTTGSVRTWVGQGTLANVVTTVSEGAFTVAGNVTATNFVATTRTFANTAIFGYGTDGSGLSGAPIVIAGNSTTSIIGTNGIANNVSSNLTIKTLNSNISLQLTGVDKTWTFDTTGDLTAPGNVTATRYLTTGNSVAVGERVGLTNQGLLAVAVGSQAGQTDQGTQATAVGSGAGNDSQGLGAVAVGTNAGAFSQGNSAVAVGGLAGSSNQGIHALALGNFSGVNGQGAYAIAMGYYAAPLNQPANSIVLNASGSSFGGDNSGFYVNPVRNDTANISEVVTFNTSTKELTYSNTISVSGNITSGNLIANNLSVSANTTLANTYVPSANNSVGTTGQITWDGDYVYICVATDTWKRANLSTW